VNGDGSNGPPAWVDDKFVPVREEERNFGLEKRMDFLVAEMRDNFELVLIKLAKLLENDANMADALKDVNERLESARSGMEGYDLRKRLAAIEEAVATKPRRTRGRK
jgi:hypothetical protein